MYVFRKFGSVLGKREKHGKKERKTWTKFESRGGSDIEGLK